MKSVKLFYSILFLGIFLFSVCDVGAEVISVINSTGNLTYLGNSATTNVERGDALETALFSALPGDVVYVHSGNFTINVRMNLSNGASLICLSNEIIINSTVSLPLSVGNNTLIQGCRIESVVGGAGQTITAYVPVYNVTIKNNVIVSDFDSVFTGTTVDSIISGNHFICGYDCINIVPKNTTVKNNTAFINRTYSLAPISRSFFVMRGILDGDNVTIEDNYVFFEKDLGGLTVFTSFLRFYTDGNITSRNNYVETNENNASVNITGFFNPSYLETNPFTYYYSLQLNTTNDVFYPMSSFDYKIYETYDLGLRSNYQISGGNYDNKIFSNGTIILFNDTTNPSVIDFGANMLANYTNSTSTSIVFNFTALDNGVIDSIVLRLYNSTGLYNSTEINNTDKSLTSYFYGNWSNLPNEVYYINATVNDTYGNNLTTYTKKITLDNTAPVVTQSCTPSSVSKGARVVCTCSATDNVDTSLSLTYTELPSTTTAGTFTTTCTATDDAGNSGTDTDTYIVTGGSVSTNGGSSSSSTSSSVATTYSLTESQLTSGYTGSISESSSYKIPLSGNFEYLTITDIDSDNIDVEFKDVSGIFNIKLDEIEKFELTGDNIYDLSVKLNSISASKANLTIMYIAEPMVANVSLEDVASETIVNGEEEQNKSYVWIFVLVSIILVGVIVYYFYYKRR